MVRPIGSFLRTGLVLGAVLGPLLVWIAAIGRPPMAPRSVMADEAVVLSITFASGPDHTRSWSHGIMDIEGSTAIGRGPFGITLRGAVAPTTTCSRCQRLLKADAQSHLSLEIVLEVPGGTQVFDGCVYCLRDACVASVVSR